MIVQGSVNLFTNNVVFWTYYFYNRSKEAELFAKSD